MEYKEFLEVLLRYKKASEEMNELYSMGFDFLEGKYKLQEQFSGIVDTVLNSHFTPKGVEWIHWFIYDADYGTKDFSKLPTYKINSEGKFVIVAETDKLRWGAHDENGNPICYSYESLWEYIQQYKKVN
jgi:hypothetical protein